MRQLSVTSLAQPIGALIRRACADVFGLIAEVITLSEQELAAAAEHIQTINRQARRHVHDLSQVVERITFIGQAFKRQAAFNADAAVRLRQQNEAAERSLRLTSEIAELASAISKISMTAEILTLNGYIESARLGQAGRPFAVIVEQLRELSEQVQQANQSISQLADDLTQVIPSIAGHARDLLELTERFSSEQASQFLGAFADTERWVKDALGTSQRRAQEIVTGTGEILSHLQFQDRMAQDLRNIEYVLQHLDRVLARFFVEVEDTALTGRAPAELLNELYAEIPCEVARLGQTLEEERLVPREEERPSGEVLLF
jgi:methyl-accepting chemotaxis protein